MVNTIVSGACGNMGQKILAQFAMEGDFHVSSALERKDHAKMGEELQPGLVLASDLSFPVESRCVLVEFSNPQATIEHLELALEKKLPVLIGTTGFSEEEAAFVKKCAEKIPILQAHNYGLGMNAFYEIIQHATRLLDGYDVDLIESHAANKPDVPSGTGKTLATIVAQTRGDDSDEVIQYGLGATRTFKRKPNEVAIHSIRAGSYKSIHTLVFSGEGEKLEFSHHEEDSAIIAKGVVWGVRFLREQGPGFYSMKDVLEFRRARKANV